MSETIPTSREVSSWDRLYRAHTGSTSDLVRIACEEDLAIELERSRAVEEFALRLLGRLLVWGTLTQNDIDQELANWHEDEVL